MSLPIDAISVLVIVYNKSVSESATLSSLMLLPPAMRDSMELVVRDNSKVCRIDRDLLLASNFRCVSVDHDGINLPLGAVYRTFVRNSKGSIIFFFDDDTLVEEAYIEEVMEALGEKAGDDWKRVCAPLIYSGSNYLFSPSLYRVFSGRHIQGLTPGRHLGLNAIMSGLATTRNYLSHLGEAAFSLRPRLYGIDTMFMLAHAKAGGATIVCKTRIPHSLNRDTKRTVRQELHRNWLEASAVFWTVIRHKRIWTPVLPFYLGYFALRRLSLLFTRRLAP